MAGRPRRDRVWVVAPFATVSVRWAVAAGRADALPVLATAGVDGAEALSAVIDRLRGGYDGPVGLHVVVPSAADTELPATAVDTVVLSAPLPWAAVEPGNALASAVTRWRAGASRVVVEVTDVDEARRAMAAGADGLVVTGCEAGGRIGATGSFVLLQQVLSAVGGATPLWVRGGIGPRTAAAAWVGGARGVVLDVQVALAEEAAGCCGPEVARALGAMDGSETRVLGGWRVLHRPDALAARLPDDVDAGTVIGLAGAGDLAAELVPAGQDAALARSLADEHGTVGRIVASVQRAMDEHVAAAKRTRPLAPGAGVAARHGMAVPVAQGPMTRVSDRAAFAKAVADGGGLPFLALSLMRGDEVRRLLEETSALLGDAPWGVGILGFVPPALRQEQLDVVHDVRPPVALIAGGRPSQAAPLEAAGIPTFLHVPSPGLLARFLDNGVRRFVFEGRECGGHVGPRTSFVLWEQQVATLDAFVADGGTDGRGSLEGVEVCFAGGIHDERSAAMVATLAAPLVERGAAIGVLMGTAYLFCEEAVAGGAILPAFQQAAVDCATTTLLETSPGHATRCVASPYVDAFEARKRQLQADGVPTSEMWAELEQLNLGRLRIAAKGLVRDGAELTAADEETQRREGMYMIGDIATLRAERTTVAALHRQVTEGATELVARRPAARAARRRITAGDVAIVGMACVFPGSPDLDAFWSTILDGVDPVREVSADRWDPSIYFDAEHRPELAGVKSPSKWGGFIDPVPFDALAYGIPPASLAAIEPVQLLALEMAARALADAGYDRRPFDRRRTGVVFGAESCSDLATAYGFRTMLPTMAGGVPDALDEFLPRMTEDSFAGMLANVIAGRIANRLDLGGLNCTVDAACAASLAALDAACKELAVGDSDMVLCGGADLHNGIQDYLLFGSVHALSPSGRCRTFDAEADGIVLGEGVACVVLKRLADAERDGDRIYAVIKAVAGSSDGRHLGLTAPRKEGQRIALERAYARAGLSPAEVGLVEAHGTGTVVGDRTEMATLAEVFAEHGAEAQRCTIGSVKSNIGHTKCAAGLAGLIKAALALHHGVRPPTIHVTHPNQAWDPETSPFRFEDGARPWIDGRRVAGVSSFGFGGSNYHVVLAAAPDVDDDPGGRPAPEPGAAGRRGRHARRRGGVLGQAPLGHARRDWPTELVVVHAADRAQGATEARRLAGWIDRAVATGSPVKVRDVAAAAAARRGHGPVQAAVVAGDLGDLAARLRAAADRLDGGGPSAPSGVFVATADTVADRLGAGRDAVAFCFPGQGSQRPGMVADLVVAFPGLRRWVRAGAPWADLMLPPAAFGTEARRAQQAALTDTRVAQPALGIAGLVVADLLAALGVRPAMAAGHSYGELVALALAGSIEPDALLALSAARADAILGAAGDDPGAMASVSADVDAVRGALAAAEVTDVVVANHNAPRQVVVSGPTPAIERAVGVLADAGLRATRLPVACAFHSPLVAAAAGTLAEHLAEVAVAAPSFPVWSNTEVAPYPPDAEGIRSLVARQVAEPVRWAEQVEAMYAAGARVFVEAGPGRVLTGLVDKVLGDRPHVAVACDVPGEPGLRRLQLALAELLVHGVDVDLRPLHAGRSTPVDLSVPPPPGPRWIVDGHLVRTRDGAVVPGSLRPLSEVPRGALVVAGAEARSQTGAPAPADDAAATAGRPPAVAAAPPLGGGGGGGAPEPATRPAGAERPAATNGWNGRDALGSRPLTAKGEQVHDGHQHDGHQHDGLQHDGHQHDGHQHGNGRPAAAAPRPAAAPAVDAPSSGGGPTTPTVPAPGGSATGWPVPTVPVVAPTRPMLGNLTVPPHSAAVDQAVATFLDTMRLAVSTQRDVLLRYLGADVLGADVPGAEPSTSAGLVTPLGPLSQPALAPPTAWTVGASAAPHAATPWTGAPPQGVGPAASVPAADAPAGPSVVWVANGGAAATGRSSLADAGPIGDPMAGATADGTGGRIGSRADGDGPESAGGGGAVGVGGGSGAAPVGSATPGGFGAGSVPAAGGAPVGSVSAAGGAGGVGGANRAASSAPARTSAPASTSASTGSSAPADTSAGVSAAARLEVRIAEAPPAAPSPASALAGSHFAITDDGRGVALALADRLEAHGATARIVVAGDPWWAAVAEGGDPLDGVVDLSALGTEDGTSVERSFPALRAAIVRNARWVVGVSAAGGRFGRPLPGTASSDTGRPVGLPPGAGLAGLCRTLALEAPDAVVRAVDVDPKVEPDRLAADIVAELLDSTGPTVVGYVDGVRHALEVVPVPLPSADLDALSSALALDGTSVTVLFGGARGITASVARALVATTGTRLVLAGRTDPDVPEPPALASVADDPVALRSTLVAAGHRDTAEIERLVQTTMAGRQVRATLADLAGLGADVRYVTVDVADAAAVRGVLDRVAAEVGRIDLVVHGAGRLEDKLVVDKTSASFARVLRPKVVGALAMAEWLADQAAAGVPAGGRRPTLVVFGSVSGVFGNRGQADYAAANDALDTLAWVLHGRPDIRVLAVDWGPWGGGAGMVTPELEQLYRRRGIGLLDPAEAVAHLLRELAFGTETAQVVVADADAAAMAGPP